MTSEDSSMNMDINISIYKESYLDKLKTNSNEINIPKEYIYKTYKEYLNSLNSNENIINNITQKEEEIHQFITENLTNICEIFNKLKIHNPELENINYSDFVDIFYNNINVNKKEEEEESDEELDDYYDDFNDYNDY